MPQESIHDLLAPSLAAGARTRLEAIYMWDSMWGNIWISYIYIYIFTDIVISHIWDMIYPSNVYKWLQMFVYTDIYIYIYCIHMLWTTYLLAEMNMMGVKRDRIIALQASSSWMLGTLAFAASAELISAVSPFRAQSWKCTWFDQDCTLAKPINWDELLSVGRHVHRHLVALGVRNIWKNGSCSWPHNPY